MRTGGPAVHDLLTALQNLPPLLVYLVAAAIVTAETALIVGLLMPGEATLLLVGFLAYLGTLDLPVVLLVMIAAGVLGDALAFRAGRRYGPRLRHSRWGARVGEHRWSRADGMLDRLGGRGVFGARWIAFVRTLMPRLAGASGMPYRRFAPFNVAGVGSWVGASVLVGFLAGESYATVSEALGQATGAVFALLAAVVGIVLVGRWLGRNPDPARALAARAAALPPARWLTRRYGQLFGLLAALLGVAGALVLNLLAGAAVLFVLVWGLAWLIGAVVRGSGLTVVDRWIADWFAGHRTPDAVALTEDLLGALRAPYVIAVVGLVALLLGWRARVWRADLVGLVSSAGAVLPLVLLALAVELTGPVARLFPSQNAVVAAGLCTLAWLLSRRAHWPRAVAVWTAATVGVVTVSGARLYVGWSTASETVTSVLLGVLWTAVLMVARATRDRTTGGPAADGGSGARPRPPVPRAPVAGPREHPTSC